MATTDVRDQLQVTLGAAYSLERELGHGGMATVFLAQDTKPGGCLIQAGPVTIK